MFHQLSVSLMVRVVTALKVKVAAYTFLIGCRKNVSDHVTGQQGEKQCGLKCFHALCNAFGQHVT